MAASGHAGRIAVMGAGSWGTAFALICADAGADVALWARRAEAAVAINAERRNATYLPDAVVPEAVRATSDPEEALAGADVVVLAIPSAALRTELAAWASLVAPTAALVSLVKGIELTTHLRATEVVREVTGASEDRVAVVSGPNLASECAARAPGATVVAARDREVADRVQAACHTSWFRAYTNPDVTGVELAGAVKNPIAIAAGMAHGMGFGANSIAVLVTRGLAEMTRLGVALGGSPPTFAGLAGTGDLVATCTSPLSRNRHVGVELGRGRALEEVVAEMRMVAEGVRSSAAILDLADAAGVEMPLVAGVVDVVHRGRSPHGVLAELMGRARKSELHGQPWTDDEVEPVR